MPNTAQPLQILYATVPRLLSSAETVKLLEPLSSEFVGSAITARSVGQEFKGSWEEFTRTDLGTIWMLQAHRAEPLLNFTWKLGGGQLNLQAQSNETGTNFFDAVRAVLPCTDEVVPSRATIDDLIDQFATLQGEASGFREESSGVASLIHRMKSASEEATAALRHIREHETKMQESLRAAAASEATVSENRRLAADALEKVDAAATAGEQHASNLKALIDQSTPRVDSLVKVETQMDSVRTKAHGLLEIATVASLNQAFKKRAAAIEKSQAKWISLIVLTSAALAWLSYRFIDSLEPGVSLDPWLLTAKALVGVPVLFLDYFFVSTFRHNRELIERYEFKNAVTQTLDTYQDVIKREHEGANETSMEFVLKTIDQIYEPPLVSPGMSERERRYLLKTIGQLGTDAIASAANAKTGRRSAKTTSQKINGGKSEEDG